MRRIVVTGANKGIGLAIVTAIVEEHDDAFVFLGARDRQRGAAARSRLPANDRIEVLELDVTSDASVAAAAREVAERCRGEEKPLFAVVNNAGIGLGQADLRAVLEVNALGMRRVCEAFVPLVRSDGRIVNVTSASGPMFVSRCSRERQRTFTDPAVTRAELDDLVARALECRNADEFAAAGLANGDAYGFSKAWANAYTMLLAREHPELRINACTPGYIETDLTRAYAQGTGKTPAELGMKSPADGARTPMSLLFGPLEGNGRYYGSDGLRSPLDGYRAPGSPAYRPADDP